VSRQAVLGVARAALLIAALTVLARVVGLGRILVFSRTVGETCLGDAYTTANRVPNVVFEVVAGGALASLVVPLLARAVSDGDREEVQRVTSALLGWVLVVLVPPALAAAVLAEPLAAALLGRKDSCPEEVVAAAASMLRVFAPQVVLYGVGIVLIGVLQAHRRFAGPALAPLLSSTVVLAAYVSFGLLAGVRADLGSAGPREQLVLSGGTTLGVAVLSLCLLVPLRATGVRLRPALRFPAGVGRRARALALAGSAALAAQQVPVVVALLLANGPGVPAGTPTVHGYAETLFLLPWAVLAVPVATSVFPVLSAAADGGDPEAFDRALAGSARTVLLVSGVAAAALVAAAGPAAAVVTGGLAGAGGSAGAAGALAAGVAAFGPGLVGYGLYALLTRALYASGATAAATLAAVLGWGVTAAAMVVASAVLPPAERVAALALGSSAGVSVLGVALLAVVRHRCGTAALAGVGRAAAAAVGGGVLAALAGRAVADRLPGEGAPAGAAQGMLVGVVVLVVFAVVALAVDREDVTALARRVPGRGGRGGVERDGVARGG